MSSPANYVTPNPAIHRDPFARQEAQMQLQAAYETLQNTLGTLPGILINGVVNAILNAFNLPGIEGNLKFLLSSLETAMQNIPADVINGVTAIEQGTINAVCIALGAPAGVNYSLGLTFDSYGLPSGLNTTNTGDIGYWLVNIPAQLIKGVTVIEQAVINAICNALGAPVYSNGTNVYTSGATVVNYSSSNVLYYLENIPNTVIKGVLGGANIGQDLSSLSSLLYGVTTLTAGLQVESSALQNILGGTSLGNDVQRHANAVIAGITDQATGTIGYLEQQWAAWTKNVFGYHYSGTGVVAPPQPQSVNANALTQAGFNKNQGTNKPIANNVDPTLDPVFHLSTVATTMPTISVTQSSSVIGFISIPDVSSTKDEIAIIGYPTGSMANFTGFYLNLYSVSTQTGAMTWIYTTENLQGVVPGPTTGTFKGVWYYYNLPKNTTTVGGVTTVTACVMQTISLGFQKYNVTTYGSTFGGTYTLGFGSATTTTLNWNDSAATVQAALAALSGIGSGNVSVANVNPTSQTYGGPFVVTFCGSLANTAQPMLTINSSLTGNTDSPSVSPYLGVFQGDVYAVELVVVGAGTYNLVGQTSLVPAITASGMYPQQLGASRTPSATASPTPPTRNSVGVGATGVVNPGTTKTITWTHNISSSAANGGAVIVMASFSATSGPASSVSAKVGTTAMTQISLTQINSTIYMATFILQNPPTGTTQSVSFTVNTSSSTTIVMAANSVSYLNVGGYSTAQTTTGNSAAPSQSVTAGPGATVVQGFFSAGAGNFANYTSPVSTAWNQVGQVNINYAMEIGDESGLSTATFATTCTSGSWGATAIQLYGALYLPGASIASPVYGATTPWFGLSGAQAQTAYPPVLTSYTTYQATPYTYPVPVWANHIDVVLVGGGGGGNYNGNGYGGLGGSWNAKTYPTSAIGTTLSVTVGNGGTGGGTSGSGVGYGGNGGGSIVSGTGVSLTASGGTGGSVSGGLGAATTGNAGANENFGGNIYYGGAASTALSPANSPGGGGNGGSYSTILNTAFPAYAGAPGAVFILAYA